MLGAIRTLERLHPKSWLRDSTLTEDSRFEALLAKINGIDIGSGFSEALPVLRSSEAFRARSLRLLGKLKLFWFLDICILVDDNISVSGKLRKINLRAMLDHHCPSNSQLLPSSQEQVMHICTGVNKKLKEEDKLSLLGFERHGPCSGPFGSLVPISRLCSH